MKKFLILIIVLMFFGCAANKKAVFDPTQPSEDYEQMISMSPDNYGMHTSGYAELLMKLATQTLDAKVSALSAITDIQATDIFYVLDYSGGTYSSKKITAINVFDLIDTAAELETVANLGAYASDFLAATSEANFKSITNLEAGTDFTLLAATHDTAAELDALYEAELDNSAGLAAALSNETGTVYVVFSESPTLTGTVIAANIDGSGTFSANLFTPDAADGAPLGTVDLEFSDFFLADGGIIYGQNDQSNTLTSGASGWTANLSYIATVSVITPLLDAAGAEDMDYGSVDVTDHTFITDGTGTAEIVLPAGSIDGTEILDDTVDSGDYAADSIDSEHINWAEPITVPFDNKIQFGDAGIYIWADDDGILDIVSDTTIESSAAWVHTGNFWATTYGSDSSVSDTELKYLASVTSDIQDQLDNITPGTGTEDHLTRWDAANALQDSLVVVNDAGAMTGLTSMTIDASATPGVTGYDSDVSDDDVWKIYGSATDANDSIFYQQVEQANALVTYLTLDGVNESVLLAKPLILYNATDPDVDTTSEMSLDTDGANETGDISIRGFDGSNQYLVTRKLQCFQATVITPNDLADGTRDACPIWSNETGMTFTVTKVESWSDTDDTEFNLEEEDANGANNATITAADIDTNGTGLFYDTVTSMTGTATVEASHIILIDFDDTDDPGWVKVSVCGWFNADVD